MEALYGGEEEEEEEEKQTVEVMFHISSGAASDIESVCVALRVMST